MIFAYLDPGAGSLLFQAILAAALTVPFFVRGKLASMVNRLKGRHATAHAGTSEEKNTPNR